jgi:hypothetical protein
MEPGSGVLILGAPGWFERWPASRARCNGPGVHGSELSARTDGVVTQLVTQRASQCMAVDLIMH